MPKLSSYQVTQQIKQEVTDRLIARVKEGGRPWLRPWRSLRDGNGVDLMDTPLNHKGRPYRGVNVWLLAGVYDNPFWLTYRQAAADGGQVRKGEKGVQIIFWKFLDVTDKATGEDKRIPMLKTYTVFNAEQCDGLPAKYQVERVELDEAEKAERIEHAESFFRAVGLPYSHRGDRAYYSPASDTITMPAFEKFESPESYYAVLAHEHVHATGHQSRLDRTLGGVFGGKDYAFEELVAELGSAYVGAHLRVTSDHVEENHVGYLASWLRKLESDPDYLFKASSQAQKAADWLVERAERKLERAAEAA